MIFDQINDKDKIKLFSLLDAHIHVYSKDNIITSNMNNINVLGVVLKGRANLIRIDYDGNKSIIEILNEGDIFESKIFSSTLNELSIIAIEECEVVLFDYNLIFSSYSKNHYYHIQFLNNLTKILINKLNITYERIQILTKRSIREKFLEYIRIMSLKTVNNYVRLNSSYSDIALYLSVDRSALMREIKFLKEDNIINIKDKKIYLNTQ